MAGYDELEQQRLDKVAALRARGVEPYPVRFERTHTAEELHTAYDDLDAGAETGARAAVAGRLMLKRGQGKLSFGVLRDGSGEVQLMVALDVAGEEGVAAFAEFDLGDWVGAEGEVLKSKRGELSVRASNVRLLAKAIRPLPEKWHGLKDVELRHRMRYVDLMTNEDARRIARVRTDAIRAIREFMLGRDFVEVETPMLQPQPGGALAKPFVTHMNALDLPLYLRIAPELYLKRLIVSGMERVFEINKNFRNEGISPQHNPEFTMMEAYQAFGDYHSMMELMEAMIPAVARAAVGTADLSWRGVPLSLDAPFSKRRLIDLASEAVGTTLDLDMPLDDLRNAGEKSGPIDASWGPGKIVVEIYERLVEKTLIAPTFVLDFPREVSPLARAHRDDPRFTEHFDLVIGGMEIGPAYSELNDPVDQRARFEDQMRQRAAGDEEAMSLDEDYLRAMEYGMPPTGGLGFGIDRFVIVLTDAPNIRETILFPFLRPETPD